LPGADTAICIYFISVVSAIAAVPTAQIILQASEHREGRLNLLVFAATNRADLRGRPRMTSAPAIFFQTAFTRARAVPIKATVRADPQTPLIAKGLDRHRERDHLTQEVVQLDYRPPIQSRLEILPETDSILSQASLPFRVRGLAPLRRLQDQSICVAKHMRIALGAAAALEADTARDFALDQHVVTQPRGRQDEVEGHFDLAKRVLARRLPIGPPVPTRFEFESIRLLCQPLDLDLEVGHDRGFRAFAERVGEIALMRKNKVF